MSERLDDTQRAVFAAITGEVSARAAADRVRPSATLSSIERLAIYQRSYLARLVECMESMFPALRFAMGAALFQRFTVDYLRRNPPTNYTLATLADAFPRYLEETRPPGEEWPLFLTNLATWELALLQVADGPGVEGQARVDTSHWTDAQILAARPEPAPCVRLFTFHYPVHRYRLAVRSGEQPEMPAPRQSCVAITRHQYRVLTYEFTLEQMEFLKQFDGGRRVADALAPPEFAADWIRDAYGKGLFCSLAG